MKLASLFCILLLFISFSETIGQQNMADSLSQAIEIMDDDDLDKVYLLNEYARYSFYDHNPAKAFLALKDAHRLAKRQDYEEGRIMYFLTLSIFHRNSEMNAYYQKKADWISERTDEEPPSIEKYSSVKISETAYLVNLVDELQSLLPQFVSEEDKEMRANIFWLIAVGHYDASNNAETFNYLSEASNVFEEIGELYPVILTSRYQILFLNNEDKEDEAKVIERYLVDLVAKSKDHNRLYFITSAMGDNYSSEGRYALAIEYYLKSVEEAERVGDMELLANIQLDLGAAYESLELNNKAVEHYKKGLSAVEELGDTLLWKYANGVIVFPLIALGDLEEAKIHMRIASNDSLSYSLDSNQNNFQLARQLDAQGQLLMQQERYVEAIPYFQKAEDVFAGLQGFEWALPFMNLYLAECYFKLDNYQTAIQYGLECFDLTDQTRVTSKASLLLSEIYAESNNLPLAYKYSKMHIDIRTETEQLDELNRIADAEIRSIIDRSQNQIADLENEKIRNEQERSIQRIWTLSIGVALLSVIILALVLYRNNKNKQKANKLLTGQKIEIETALKKLESTQSQLIQSEKMASLGELTAGIAHEIQNPLNFVNNFSEINTELISEIQDERQKTKDNRDEGLENDLLKDIGENQEKINHHGHRASDIVKSMLEHSRSGDGQKEPTDINKLADEYLRLAYHGLRAKDKSFNADFELDLDESLPKVSVVPQDIGRVLLNLINNAFFVVRDVEKPLVTVSTKAFPLEEGEFKGVEICVSDNGPGIPDDIKDKIFQPFFTTKPTGQGTGLGLSMSYDIITKGHGGELKLESQEQRGTTFSIILPNKAKS